MQYFPTGSENKTQPREIASSLEELVNEFNTLFHQKHFEEAEALAKKAKELDPENSVTIHMFWKARFARRYQENMKEEV